MKSYPFSVPSLQNISGLDLSSAVTFFVGENGSGKSTLLEGIAEYCGFDREGGSRNVRFAPRESRANTQSFTQIAEHLSVVWDKRPKDGWYLRAESFFNVASYFDELSRDDFRALSAYGGESLHHMSHGEAFLNLFTNRFSHGLFLLDEPEAALSPQRQLSLLKILIDLTKDSQSESAQFVIATHSPILLSCPGAAIYSFDNSSVRRIEYNDVPAVELTKSFLNNPNAYLRHLTNEET